MLIGVKYCGGCNPIYNRGRQVKRLQEQFPEHEFDFAAGDMKECDIGLIVCGCVRECASTDGIAPKKKLFLLPTERSFSEVRTYLEQYREMEKAAEHDDSSDGQAKENSGTDGRKHIRIGDTAEFKKTFFRDDVDKFAALTGDYSRLHTDAEFAKKTPYGKPVVHGVLAASLISTVMGTKLPGEGTILIEEQIRFLRPVFYGDTVTAKVTLTSCKERADGYIGTFSGTCENQNHETVVWAECRQMMSKELFIVEKEPESSGGKQQS